MTPRDLVGWLRALTFALVGLVVVSWAAPAQALTAPISGAVAYPSSGPKLVLPMPAGYKIKVLSGYSPSGGSSLHADTNACCKTNDYYALDLVYDGQPNSGKGLPILAPLPGKVVKAGWATSGWANYGQRVILEHDLGDGHVYHSLYAHMNSVDVAEGATVSVGQQIGTLGQSCMEALSCSSFGTPHLHWALHRDSLIGGSGTGGSYGGNAVVPEPFDGAENLTQGVIITSTNSGAPPKCGDGTCNGSETTQSCPDDCPACPPIPPQGRVVDDSEDLCFDQSGTMTYWHQEAAGHLNTLWWTTATADPAPDNWAEWKLDFSEAGDYQVEAFITTAYAQSKQAKYTVKHGAKNDAVALDQSASGGWRDLGTFAFDAGGNQSVRLDDNSGEAVSLKRQLLFDAVRLTRIGGSGGAGGAAGMPGTGGAGAAPAGGASSGGTGGGAGGAGVPSSGGSGASPATGSTDEATDGGCACHTRGRAGAPAGALGFALGLALAALRRRRR